MMIKLIGFWCRIAGRFLFRSGHATTVLTVMVVCAVATLIFLAALAVGVNDAMIRNSVGLFSGHITGRKLPASIRPGDLNVDGVKGVLKRVWLPVVISHQGLGRSLMLCGVDPVREIALTALPQKIIAGGYPGPGSSGILIGKGLADELKVQPGSVLSVASESRGASLRLTVSGIFQSGVDSLDRGVAICPMEAISSMPDFWTATIFLHTGVNPEDVIGTYHRRWTGKFEFETWSEALPDLRQLIDLQYLSMAIVILLVFSVVAIGIACSFVIFIIRNMREYGIMKAMGITTRELAGLLLVKVALMNAMACTIGLLLGCLAVWTIATSGGIDISAFTSHNRYFTVSGIIYPRLTLFSLVTPPATAFVFSLLAAVWPAAMVAAKKTAEILRMI